MFVNDKSLLVDPGMTVLQVSKALQLSPGMSTLEGNYKRFTGMLITASFWLISLAKIELSSGSNCPEKLNIK